MQCESCQQREATIVFTTVVGDGKRTLHLCPQCARRESDQQVDDEAPPAKVTPTQVSGPKKINVVVGHLAGTEARQARCPECGMTYDEFRRIGRLGCAQCYQAFGVALRRLLKRIHGADAHVGRRPQAGTAPEPAAAPPVSADSVDHLRQALQEAVAAEEYERAAELRDRITRLQEEEGEA